MGEQNAAPPEDRYFIYDKETVAVDEFDVDGYILDVGGGGEGIIGILKGEQVVAIDLRKDELEEAPDGPLKVVADARDLPFLDGTFDAATAFYSLMYLKSRSDCAKAFAEVFRVLKPGGRFLIWESTVERPPDTDKPAYVLFLRILVGGQEINTGYGQPWPAEAHDDAFYIRCAQEAGFELATRSEAGLLFFLELRKP
ncbi:class I SAM-dependent methyltransferase [Candidatus Bipolaricaulota bacterium]|nr:class I SAM-dependent methyltransferase [Candidatus Bipolaricaulota bacterium]